MYFGVAKRTKKKKKGQPAHLEKKKSLSPESNLFLLLSTVILLIWSLFVLNLMFAWLIVQAALNEGLY